MKVKVPQSCPTLCDPVNYTVHGILQARILEWIAVPFSRGSSQPRDSTQVSHIAGGFFTSWARCLQSCFQTSRWLYGKFISWKFMKLSTQNLFIFLYMKRTRESWPILKRKTVSEDWPLDEPLDKLADNTLKQLLLTLLKKAKRYMIKINKSEWNLSRETETI